MRYTHTDRNSDVTWNIFGVFLGELTHLTVPKTIPVYGWGNNADENVSRYKNKVYGRLPAWALPVKPPPPAPQRHLTVKQRQERDKAKARREALKALNVPPKVEIKTETKERLLHVRFNHKMRFVVRLVTKTTIITTEYRSTNPNMGKENKTKGQAPVMKSSTEKIKYSKHTKVPLDQFEIYQTLGRVVWDEEMKRVFEQGNREIAGKRNGAVDDGEEEAHAENVGESVRGMGGLMAVMRKVMACPPPDPTIQQRAQCFDCTGKFYGFSRGI